MKYEFIKNKVRFISSQNTRLAGLILVAALGIACLFTTPTHAASWDAGKIIDDLVFTNTNTMSPGGIQDFLNSKVPACDTWGTQPSEYGGGTRAQYAASKGVSPPFTCLKDYSENGRSAAQIIYDVAQNYRINPQVLLVLLQKEQGLVTDSWPWPIQYRSATGYGCPDTAPCDAQYYGLTNQLGWAAKMFRSIMDANPNWYTPYVLGNNYIQYSPDASCGGSNVNIQNRATQALYNYTPYQPNQAALNAGYGTAPCGAYGNRNFWLYFNDWFGPTTDANLYFAVIKSPNSPALYLQTSAGKYYIPSGEILQAWGLDKLTVKNVPQSYIDSLPNHDWLERLLKDDWGNLFFVDNAKLHYIRSGNYLSLWNLNPNKAAQSLGLAYSLPSSDWVGRFARDTSQPNGQIWLIDKGQKRAVPSGDMLYQWGYVPSQLTTVTSTYLNSLSTSSNVDRYVAAGGVSYLIDTGRRFDFLNNGIKDAYYGSRSPQQYDAMTLALVPAMKVDHFGVGPDGVWYMFENNKKHAIPNGNIAALWGKTSTPTPISQGFLASLSDGGNLTHVVQTSNPSMYWMVDGTKHYISDTNTANAWIPTGSSPPLYSNESLNLLYRGADATTKINATGSPYTYALDSGTKRYLTTPGAVQAWGGATMNVASQLVNTLPEGSFVNSVVKNNAGQAYLLMSNQSYTIDPAFYDAWGVTTTTPKVSDSTLNRFPSSGTTLKAFIKINGTSYVMSGGNKIPITTYADAYKPSSLNEITLPNDYLPSLSQASYLVQSTDTGDSRVWLINQGKKLLVNFSQQVSLGYISKGVNLTKLSPATLALIGDDSQTLSPLIQKQGSGVKLLNFGSSLGFPDSDTLTRYIDNNGVTIVSDSIYNNINLTGSVSKLIRDDEGKIYLMEGGKKRWISTGSAYEPYKSIAVTYLYGTTMTLIPTGSPIN